MRRTGTKLCSLAAAHAILLCALAFMLVTQVVAAESPVVIGSPIPIGHCPGGIAVSPDGLFVYVATGYGDGDDALRIIDAQTRDVVIVGGLGRNPALLALSPDGSRAYVTNTWDETVSVIDTNAQTVIATWDVGDPYDPTCIAISPDGAKLYITRATSDTLAVVDTVSGAVIAGPAVGDFPYGVAASPTGDRILVANGYDDTVTILDAATNAPIGLPVAVGDAPYGVVVSPDGGTAYITNKMAGSLSVLDVASRATATYALHGRPQGIAISPDGKRLYITNETDHDVTVVDTSSLGVVAHVPVGNAPNWIAVSPDGTRAYVGNAGSDTVSVIDTGRAPQGPTDAVGPVVYSVVAAPNPAPVNTQIILTATADDSSTGGSDIASAEYQINDGAWVLMDAEDGTFDEVTEDVTVTMPQLEFPSPGVYTISVRATDAAGNVGQPDWLILAVYDPEGGFVTGGGWINSPAGAYAADPTLTGKANFGFVAKYKKGATEPVGQTEFQFRVADLDFHSTSYQWLVVAGTKAQFKGSGAINGQGDYGFMLTATDGDLKLQPAPDTFRIKIWDKATDQIVYDNKIGEPDDSDAGTEIGGGNIVIHKEK